MENQYDLWQRTGAVGQMEQLKKAGLNPGLMYGMGGAGGATTGSPGGPTVQAGEAPKGEPIKAMDIMNSMQLSMMQAQKENIEADTKNKLADAENKPLTGENIQASTKSILQGINNAKAQEKLTGLQSEMQNIQNDIAGRSQEAQITQIENLARKTEKEIDILINQGEITNYQAVNAEATAKENLINLLS